MDAGWKCPAGAEAVDQWQAIPGNHQEWTFVPAG